MPDAEEPVGTLAEEAARLFAAVVTGDSTAHDTRGADATASPGDAGSSTHRCTHGWCPLCQAADYVREHPEVVSQVLVAGTELLKVVRDAVEKTAGRGERGEGQA